MKIYLFTSDIKLIKELELIGLDGVLHTYNAEQDNAFIAIAKNIKKTNIKHMVAVRPYTISPQLLSQIGKTFDTLFNKKILQINLVSGWIKENEKDFGGIIGTVDDGSDKIEKSKYLIEYVESLESLKNKNLDYYVSVTNNFTFDIAEKHNSKMIIHYSQFDKNKYNIKDKHVMVVVQSATNDGSAVSHEKLFENIKNLEESGIKEIIFPGGEEDIMRHTIDFIKKYKKSENKNLDYGKINI